MGTMISYDAAQGASTPEMAYYSYFDAPSTTSQVTYKVGVYQGFGFQSDLVHQQDGD